MNMISSPGRPGNEACDRIRPALAWLTLATFALGSQAAAPEQVAAPEQKAAVLKLHEASFFYRSRVAHLSCSDLESRVSSILRVLGARDDVKVDATGCEAVVMPQDDTGMTAADPWQTSPDRWRSSSDRWQGASDRLLSRDIRREQSSHVRVRAMMPIEVTPEVLEEIRKDKSRRELVSRLTGNPAAARNDPILFPAQRRPVALSHSTLRLEPEECELLEQMSKSILRDFGMRVIRSSGCDREQISHTPPHAIVETLMPVFSEPLPAAATDQEAPDPGTPGTSETPQSAEPAGDPPPK